MTPETLKSSGWTALEGRGFTAQLGSIWLRGVAGERTIGFLAEPRHGNNHVGAVHGGALMTFADIALGYGAADALGDLNCVTAQLQLHFVARGEIGEFVSCRPEVVRRTSQLVFMRGLILGGERTVASADGIWKVIAGQRPK